MWLGEEHVGAISTGFTSLQGVVDMLEKLHDKFEDERTDLEKEESNARHAYEMLIQDLTAQVSAEACDAVRCRCAKVIELRFAIAR